MFPFSHEASHPSECVHSVHITLRVQDRPVSVNAGDGYLLQTLPSLHSFIFSSASSLYFSSSEQTGTDRYSFLLPLVSMQVNAALKCLHARQIFFLDGRTFSIILLSVSIHHSSWRIHPHQCHLCKWNGWCARTCGFTVNSPHFFYRLFLHVLFSPASSLCNLLLLPFSLLQPPFCLSFLHPSFTLKQTLSSF